MERPFLENGTSVVGEKKDTEKEELEKTKDELFKKAGQQQYEIDWQKKLESAGVVEKRKMIAHDKRISISRQCNLIGLPRSSRYYSNRPMREADLQLMKCIVEIFTDNPDFGSRQIRNTLRRDNRKIMGP